MVKKYIADDISETDPLLTVTDVARMLSVSRTLIYVLIARGELPTVHIGHALRFRPRDVQDYIRKRSRQRTPKPGSGKR